MFQIAKLALVRRVGSRSSTMLEGILNWVTFQRVGTQRCMSVPLVSWKLEISRETLKLQIAQMHSTILCLEAHRVQLMRQVGKLRLRMSFSLFLTSTSLPTRRGINLAHLHTRERDAFLLQTKLKVLQKAKRKILRTKTKVIWIKVRQKKGIPLSIPIKPIMKRWMQSIKTCCCTESFLHRSIRLISSSCHCSSLQIVGLSKQTVWILRPIPIRLGIWMKVPD